MALALLCLVLFLAIGIVLLIVPGAALIGVLFLAAALLAAIWLAVVLVTHGSVGVVFRWPRRAELLGPGGPDDPDR
jgi:threonine/homoserine efflux transporter RhtA